MVMPVAHGVQGHVLKVPQFCELALRNGAHIRDVGYAAESESQYGHLVVHSPDGNHRHPAGIGAAAPWIVRNALSLSNKPFGDSFRIDNPVTSCRAETSVRIDMAISLVPYPDKLAAGIGRLDEERFRVDEVNVPFRCPGIFFLCECLAVSLFQ